MKKFLIGCGITALVLIAVGFGTSFYLFSKLKSELAVGDQVEAGRKALREQYGQPGAFVPETVFAPDRFDSYLQIREAIHDFVAPSLVTTEDQFDRSRLESKGNALQRVRGLTEMLRGGVGALRMGLSAMAVRDSLLLATGMPEGEYVYYHCLAVYSWLEWTPPEPTPDSRLLDDEDWTKALQESREKLRSVYLDVLRNQADALAARSDLTAEEQAYENVLDEQLQRRWHQTDEWPLQGVLPETVTAALVPSEARLRATLPRTSLAFFIDTMATNMEVEQERGLQVKFD